MSNPGARMCVLMPCGGELRWAVPQTCLAEIMTLVVETQTPPSTVAWRGFELPVVDPGAASGTPWRDPQSGTGLIVVLPCVAGEAQAYWGMALRGDGLSVREIQEADCQDLPESRAEYSLAAFELEGAVYQVPDLPCLEPPALAGDTAISA